MTIRVEITAETPDEYEDFVVRLARGIELRSIFRDHEHKAPPREYGWTEVPVPFGLGKTPIDQETLEKLVANGDLRPAAAHPDEGGPATPVEPAPAKARRRTKAEIEAARAADAPTPLAEQVVSRAISETPEERTEPVAEEQPAAQPEPTPAVEAAPLSHDDVRRALKALVDKKGMPVATKVLMDLGYGMASAVPTDKIAEVIAAVDKATAS